MLFYRNSKRSPRVSFSNVDTNLRTVFLNNEKGVIDIDPGSGTQVVIDGDDELEIQLETDIRSP